jgi:hypothetical protein
MSGAIFCSQCGAQLVESNLQTTNKIHLTETREDIKSSAKPSQTPPAIASDAWISLYVLDSGQILPLADRNEFTLGRAAEDQPIVPDVDLSAYNALANGVSRLHAALKRVSDKIVLVDLGSSNGTFLNGNSLSPYSETPLAHGDVVHLGKLRIQVLFRQESQ